jgi:hypothetical protein
MIVKIFTNVDEPKASLNIFPTKKTLLPGEVGSSSGNSP